MSSLFDVLYRRQNFSWQEHYGLASSRQALLNKLAIDQATLTDELSETLLSGDFPDLTKNEVKYLAEMMIMEKIFIPFLSNNFSSFSADKQLRSMCLSTFLDWKNVAVRTIAGVASEKAEARMQ